MADGDAWEFTGQLEQGFDLDRERCAGIYVGNVIGGRDIAAELAPASGRAVRASVGGTVVAEGVLQVTLGHPETSNENGTGDRIEVGGVDLDWELAGVPRGSVVTLIIERTSEQA